MKKEILIIGIIFLFIGVGIQPAFAIDISKDKTSNNDLVEIKLKIYRFNGIETYTAWLTKKQAQEYENIIDKYKLELDNAETFEEEIKIKNDLVESFYKLGIMPESLDVSDAKQLVTGGKYSSECLDSFPIIRQYQEKLNLSTNKIQEITNEKYSKPLNIIKNSFCQISGESQFTYAVPIGSMICNRIMQHLFDIFIIILPKLFPESSGLWLLLFYGTILPFNTLSDILIMKATTNKSKLTACGLSYSVEEQENVFIPSSGWVHTRGLLGEKELNGTLYGHLGWQIFFLYRIHIGVKGFTGIWSFNVDTEEAFYSGYARKVKIGTAPPS